MATTKAGPKTLKLLLETSQRMLKDTEDHPFEVEAKSFMAPHVETINARRAYFWQQRIDDLKARIKKAKAAK